MEKRQSKVKVVIRVRPPLKESEKNCVSVDAKSIQIFNHRNVQENIQYDFSAVYGMASTQQEIYADCVKPLLPAAVNGQNVSIFAYGPTGAGKTHTMLGTASNPGVIPRVINGLFQTIEEERSKEADAWKYEVAFSYLEIYNEKVQDLLEPSNADLPIREDAEKNILVPGLAKREIHNFDEFKLAFGPASNNRIVADTLIYGSPTGAVSSGSTFFANMLNHVTMRTVGSTKLNNYSSRSHSILQLNVTKSQPCKVLHGKIYLIDLAGSEDNRRTGNKGIRLKESGAINKSLFSLGEVVDAINNGLPRIPYRNSKLTRLLQDSIGGTCHSVMITNIAPEERYYYDTYCTLNFATKSKKIVNNNIVRETIGIVKPQVQERKVATVRPSRENGRPSHEGESAPKKPRLLDCSTDSIGSEPAHSLSPLMKRQAQLEEVVSQRMAEMEQNLLTHMKNITGKPNVQTGAETPRTKAIHEMQRQLEASHAQLRAIMTQQAQNSQTSQPAPTGPGTTATVTPTVAEESKKSAAAKKDILTDKTNLPSQEAVKPKGRPLAGIKRKKEDDFSCSPLFAPAPRVFKKGFTSSASSSKLKESLDFDDDTKLGKPSAETDLVNSVSQQKRNEEFLEILNSSSVKELQSLQTVGAKRAKLIYEWRQTYGPFKQASALADIPSFTEKYIQKLLHSNLITVT